jgi:hypothetical protein
MIEIAGFLTALADSLTLHFITKCALLLFPFIVLLHFTLYRCLVDSNATFWRTRENQGQIKGEIKEKSSSTHTGKANNLAIPSTKLQSCRLTSRSVPGATDR